MDVEKYRGVKDFNELISKGFLSEFEWEIPSELNIIGKDNVVNLEKMCGYFNSFRGRPMEFIYFLIHGEVMSPYYFSGNREDIYAESIEKEKTWEEVTGFKLNEKALY